jgi:hypothetical protein
MYSLKNNAIVLMLRNLYSLDPAIFFYFHPFLKLFPNLTLFKFFSEKTLLATPIVIGWPNQAAAPCMAVRQGLHRGLLDAGSAAPACMARQGQLSVTPQAPSLSLPYFEQSWTQLQAPA